MAYVDIFLTLFLQNRPYRPLYVCIMWRPLCAHCGPGILKKPLAIKFKVISIEA